MKAVFVALAVIMSAWLQASWFGHMRPLGVIPNVVLVLVVVCALWLDATPALATALAGGLLLDMASSTDFGWHMGFYVVIVLAIVAGRQIGLRADSLITGCIAIIAGTVLYNAVVLATLGASLNWVAVGRIGAELIDNLVLIALVFGVRANVGSRARTTLEVGGGLQR